MKIHIRGDWVTKNVWINGKPLQIKRSHKIRFHSTQFNWGYGGSGPAQLALAISLLVFGTDKHYQALKFRYIAVLPQDQDINQDLDLTDYAKEFELKIVDKFNTKSKD